MESDLAKFLSGQTAEERVGALGRLASTPSRIHQLVKTPEFEAALPSLLEAVRDSREGAKRILAVVYVSKLAAVAKPKQKALNEWLTQALEEPVPPLTSLQGSR